MEKLIEMLKGLGASEELSKGICEELQKYRDSVNEKYEGEYKEKIERAKRVCLEEVAKEKVALAKRVKIFLESKVSAIEQAVASKRAIEESESAAKLKKAKAVLEGVEIKDGVETNQRLVEAEKTIARLQEALISMKEERNAAIAKASQASEIAAKTLQKNRALESKLVKPVMVEGYCSDHKLPFPKDGKCAKCNKSEAPKEEPKAVVKVEEHRKVEVPKTLDESRVVPYRSTVTRSHGDSHKPVTEIGKIADTINE